MTGADPNILFSGRLLIVVPHMDDCVLACGGTIAQLSDKDRVHVVYATDGMASPAPVIPWRDRVSPNLYLIRKREAQASLGCLGVPEENIYFLGLPDGRLKHHVEQLQALLIEKIDQIQPHQLLIPFRYDRHADHLAINHAVIDASQEGDIALDSYEYFVYHHWRLLPGGDVRKYIHPKVLFQVDIEDVSARKRAALDLFKSQTTKFFAWQRRPNLTPQLLDDFSQAPEFFLKYDPSWPGTTIFTGSITRIRLVHWMEPRAKQKKDWAVNLWRRGFAGNGSHTK